jgi:hypothetical protein
MKNTNELTLQEVIGKRNYERIEKISYNNSLDLFVENRKRGLKFSCCFISNNIKLTTGEIVDVFVRQDYESVTRNKWKVTFSEVILFEQMEDYILDKINNYNKENTNKVFFIKNRKYKKRT